MRALRLVALLPILALGHLPARAQMDTPKAAVEGFAALDAQGARLRSTATDPIWKFTIDDGEPPVQPIVVIRKYSVPNGTTQGGSATVPVRFDVLGVLKDDGTRLQFVPAHELKVERFTVLHGDAGWQISLAKLRVSPHVQPEGCLKHLGSLISDYDPAKDSHDARYQSLLQARAAIEKLNTSR